MYCTLSPPNTYFTCSITFCVCGGSSSAKLKGQGLVTGHWSLRPNLNLWPGAETLLQAITWPRPPKFTTTRLASVCSCINMHAKYHFPGDLVKTMPAMQETWVQSLGQEDPLEKGMATHSTILAWRILWTEEPGVLQFMEL